jgi:uncharacterized LabA/DUF88 family protein
MSRCAVLVDAGYLFKAGGAHFVRGEARREQVVLDGAAAIERLREIARTVTGNELLRVYWYDAAAKGPTPEHRAIAELANVKLRLGHLNSYGQQKGVDPLIITDMITLARNRACDDFLLLSGDADLVVGVLQAQEHGVRVHLLGIAPSRANQAPSLRQEADGCHEWDAAQLQPFMRAATTTEITARQTRIKPSVIRTTPAKSGAAVDTRADPPKPIAPAIGAATVRPSVVVGASTVVSEGHLRTVAEAVERDLDQLERQEVASSTQATVPSHIDRRLLGTAKSMLGTWLQESDKRLLRRLLHDLCVSKLSIALAEAEVSRRPLA